MGDVVDLPGLGVASADDPGHRPASAVAAVTGVLVHRGDVRVLGRVVAPWRMSRYGPLAVLVEGEVRLACGGGATRTRRRCRPGRGWSWWGRWGLAGTTLVVDTDELVVLVDPPGDDP